MDSDAFYLFFAGISGIGALWMLRGKTLDKNEQTGIGIIAIGFTLQTIWYVIKSGWAWLEILLLVAYVVLACVFYFMGRKFKQK